MDLGVPEIDIDEVAAVLLRYMRERRGAGDTLRGITRWWWERQAFEDAYRRVELALEQLVAAGDLMKRPLAGGEDLFYVPDLARAGERGGGDGRGEPNSLTLGEPRSKDPSGRDDST